MTVAHALSIATDHPAFAGHFPGRPVVPGVVLLDLCLRALVAQRGDGDSRWTIDNAKFLSPVLPGDALTVSIDDVRGRLSLRLVARSGDDVERVAMTVSLSHPVAH